MVESEGGGDLEGSQSGRQDVRGAILHGRHLLRTYYYKGHAAQRYREILLEF